MAKNVTVSDDDLRAYYDQHKSEFQKPETRSVQVVVGAEPGGGGDAGRDLERPARIGTRCRRRRRAADASAVELDDTTAAGLPAVELAQRVFAAPANAVTGPIQSDLGWQLFRVVKVTPATVRSFDDVKADLHTRVALERATDLVYDRANKGAGRAGRRGEAGRVAGRPRPGRRRRHAGRAGQHAAGHARADSRLAGSAERDRVPCVPDGGR